MQEIGDAKLMSEVFSKVPSAIIILDEQGIVKTVNEAASALLGEEDLTERRWVEIVSEAFRPRHDDGHEISTKDGRRLQVTTLPLEHGQLIQMTDLTETRALQDKMAHMERLSSLGRMAASLAHQIRTPLSAAMLYAANLANANLQPMARKRFQEKLMSRLEALEAQVSDILMFARSNEQTVSEIDAGSLMDITVNNVSAIIQRNSVDLQTIADAGAMPILGNSTALSGALSNLITNAVEAGASRVIFKLLKDDDKHTISFSIANNGPKIPEEQQAKIFEPFFTSKSSGTGLGLAVVSAVTKVHQGTIELSTQDDEFATVFTLTIPLYKGSTGSQDALAQSADGLNLPQSTAKPQDTEPAPQPEHAILKSAESVDTETMPLYQQTSAKAAFISPAAYSSGLGLGPHFSSSLQQDEEEELAPTLDQQHETASGSSGERFMPMNWNEVEINVSKHGAFVATTQPLDVREHQLHQAALDRAQQEEAAKAALNAKESSSVGEANAVLFAAMRSQHASRR